MGKTVLFFLTFIAISATVIVDLFKRANDGIPDVQKTQIRTLSLKGNFKAGASALDITNQLTPLSPLPPAFEEEKALNPLLAGLEPENKAVNAKHPKFINRFYLKSLACSNGKSLSALFATDMPSLTPECLDSARGRLRKDFGIDGNFLVFFSSGLNLRLEIRPADFAAAASQCLRLAMANLQPVEMTVVKTAETAYPSCLRHVSLQGVGGFDLPAFSTLTRNDTLPAGVMETLAGNLAVNSANRWLYTLTGDSTRFASGSLRPAELLPQTTVLVAIRSLQDRFLGGLVLAPYPPTATRTDYPEITSDYIAHLCAFLEKKYGGTFLFVRSPGTDILPILDNTSYSSAQRVGNRIGNALAMQMKKAQWSPVHEAFFYTRPLALSLKPWSNSSVPELRRLHERYYLQAHAVKGLDIDIAIKRDIQDKYLTAYYLYEYFSRGGKPLPSPLQAVRLGDHVLLLGLPGECMTETGARLIGAPGKFDILVADNCGGPLFPIVPLSQFDGGYACNQSIFAPAA